MKWGLLFPSSMPFQLKSAVVIKFQQGLGATVQHTDGGCPDTKMTQFKRTGGARQKRREGDKCCSFAYSARFVLLNLHDISKNRKWNGYSDLMKSRNDLFLKSGIFLKFCLLHLRHVHNILQNFRGINDEVGENSEKLLCVCICVSTNLWLTEGRWWLLIHIIMALIQRPQRGHTPAVPLSLSFISRTT